ncbi:MAG: hypothetical protein WAO98_03840 [Alphaproteobacteria bacterium]
MTTQSNAATQPEQKTPADAKPQDNSAAGKAAADAAKKEESNNPNTNQASNPKS